MLFVGKSENVRNYIFYGKPLTISSEDLEKEYIGLENKKFGYTIGSYILFKKGEPEFRRVLISMGIENIEKTIEDTRNHCEAVVGLSSYVSGNTWQLSSNSIDHVGAPIQYKDRITQDLDKF